MPANLEALRIDRGERTERVRRRRGPRWPRRVAWAVLFTAAIWIFQRPLRGLIDRLRLPEVRVARAVRRDAGSAAAISGAAANGYIMARTSAALSSDFPARLVEMNVVEGSRVSKGDVVARLYYEELEAALAGAEADVALAEASVARAAAERQRAEQALPRLSADAEAAAADVLAFRARAEFARADHRRVAALVAKGDVTASRLDEAARELAAAEAEMTSAEARHASARAAVKEGEEQVAVAAASVAEERSRALSTAALRDQARAALDKTYIRAPFDGIVVQKEAEVGEVVSPNSQGGGSLTRGSVATIFDPSSLEVQAEVAETTLAAVRIGEPALIYVDAWPGEPYRGRIDRIWPVADRQKATIEVRIAIEGIDERLRPEMGVRVVFLDERGKEADARGEAASAAAVLIPMGAIVRIGGEDGAFVLERDVARFQTLALGEERAGRVVVQQGLDGSETVILEPPPTLGSGDRVRTQEQ